MANVRFCAEGRHEYIVAGARSKCTRCGAVQVDLSSEGLKADPTRVFGARRPTLFSLRSEPQESDMVPFGRPRHRR